MVDAQLSVPLQKAGALLLGFVVLLGGGACSGSDPSAVFVPSAPTTAVPSDLAAGTGDFTLGGVAYAVTVTSCQLDPTVDPATSITTVFALDGTSVDASMPFTVEVLRQVTSGAATTTTDTITFAPPAGDPVQAQRASLNGAYVDLRQPGVGVAMLDIGSDTVTADAMFGPAGSVSGDTGVVEGVLTARCP